MTFVKTIKTGVASFFSNPIVGATGWLATVAGLVLTIVFWVGGKEHRQLTFYVNPVKATLVKAGQVSRLTASFDNNVIEKDISAAQIAFWNRGTLPIKKENVLQQFVLETENNTPILEASIRKTTRDITGIELDNSELQRGRLTVRWSILEFNDGAVVQIIYEGPPATPVFASGVIEGQAEILKLEHSGKLKSEEEQMGEQRFGNRLAGWLFTAFGLGAIVGSAVFYWRWRKRKKSIDSTKNLLREIRDTWENSEFAEPRKQLMSKYVRAFDILARGKGSVFRFSPIIFPLGMLIAGLLYLGLGLYLLVGKNDVGPPFGF